jgi:hypothetical protein
MTGPGGAPGEGEHDVPPNQPPADARTPDQPGWSPPWGPPPPDYPPPGYPPDYPPGYPEPFPPAGYPPPAGAQYPPPQFGPPAAGYGPPSSPGGYYPAPGYPGGWGPSQPASQPGTNRLAIASLITSFTGVLCCVGSLVAIVLGAIALDQIKRTREEGSGLAVAGIVIGVAGLLVYLIVGIFALRFR